MSFVLLERRTTMKADVGDRLVTEGSDGPRECLIIGLHRSDGAPPYVVRWRFDGHIALVYPGPYTRLVHSAKDFMGSRGLQQRGLQQRELRQRAAQQRAAQQRAAQQRKLRRRGGGGRPGGGLAGAAQGEP